MGHARSEATQSRAAGGHGANRTNEHLNNRTIEIRTDNRSYYRPLTFRLSTFRLLILTLWRFVEE